MPFNTDVAATAHVDAYLDAMLGSGIAFELALFTGDPRTGGVEIAGSGYARVAGVDDATFWQAASGGSKRSLTQSFPVPTADDWDIARWEGRFIGGVLVDFEPLADPIDVTQAWVDAATVPQVQAVRGFAKIG